MSQISASLTDELVSAMGTFEECYAPFLILLVKALMFTRIVKLQSTLTAIECTCIHKILNLAKAT